MAKFDRNGHLIVGEIADEWAILISDGELFGRYYAKSSAERETAALHQRGKRAVVVQVYPPRLKLRVVSA